VLPGAKLYSSNSQHCGALWLVEVKQSTALSPFKPHDLVECYDMLKLHARCRTAWLWCSHVPLVANRGAGTNYAGKSSKTTPNH
jgi:hypothetical protein